MTGTSKAKSNSALGGRGAASPTQTGSHGLKSVSDTDRVLVLDGTSLDCEELLKAAAGCSRVTVACASMERIFAGRALVEKIAKSGVPAYGITTGVGSQKEFAVSPQDMRQYNRRLARAHSSNAGGAFFA